MHFHANRFCYFRQYILGRLHVLTEEGIKKRSFANVMPQFPVLKEDVHRFPQCVIKNLDQFLMHERIVRSRLHEVRSFRTRQSKGHCIATTSCLQRRPDFGITLRRSEAHNDIRGLEKGLKPWPEHYGKIKRGQRAFSHDDGMHELDGYVLGIRGIGATAKGQQASPAQKTLRHFLARARQTGAFIREKALEYIVSFEKRCFDLANEIALGLHDQQMRGKGSPTSMSM